MTDVEKAIHVFLQLTVSDDEDTNCLVRLQRRMQDLSIYREGRKTLPPLHVVLWSPNQSKCFASAYGPDWNLLIRLGDQSGYEVIRLSGEHSFVRDMIFYRLAKD